MAKQTEDKFELQQWEYLEINYWEDYRENFKIGTFQEYLNWYGNKGWELVSFYLASGHAVFKRPTGRKVI